jgi:hypothetical protein
MLHPGTLFVWLFFGLAPGVTVLLLVRSIGRAVREMSNRVTILLAAGAVLGVWAAATYYMFLVAFATAWGVAHLRPIPPGMFPEGWEIYGWLTAYTILGIALDFIVGTVPRKRAAAS